MNILRFLAVGKLKDYNGNMKTKKILMFCFIMAIVVFTVLIGTRFFWNKEEGLTQKGVKIKVEAIKDVVLVQDKNLKTWSVLEHNTNLQPEVVLATYGDNSGLLLSIKKDLTVGLDKDSSIKISVTKDGKEELQLIYGCFGIKEANKDFIFKCSQKDASFTPVSPTVIYENKTIMNVPVSPCGEMLEAASGEDTLAVTLGSSGLKSSFKLFQVASDIDFKNKVFESKTYSNVVKTTPLKAGKYYWKLDGGKACSFEVDKKAILNVLRPSNQETVSDSSIEFEWDIDAAKGKNTLVIFSANSGTVQSVEIKGSKYVIDDVLQTLGPGNYFWYVRDQKDHASTPRSFYVLTGQDIVLETPTKGSVIDAKQNFILLKWAPMVGVKSYGVSISSNPSFLTMEYANATEEPFVFVPMLKEGSYFLKISALFDNSKKIATEAIPFSVKKTN